MHTSKAGTCTLPTEPPRQFSLIRQIPGTVHNALPLSIDSAEWPSWLSCRGAELELWSVYNFQCTCTFTWVEIPAHSLFCCTLASPCFCLSHTHALYFTSAPSHLPPPPSLLPVCPLPPPPLPLPHLPSLPGPCVPAGLPACAVLWLLPHIWSGKHQPGKHDEETLHGGQDRTGGPGLLSGGQRAAEGQSASSDVSGDPVLCHVTCQVTQCYMYVR